MDAVVQFLRNALCCVKDLGLFKESVPDLWDSKILERYYRFPEPLNKTTPLELMICLSQLYATCSLCLSGWRLFNTSYGKLVRVQRILNKRFDKKSGDETEADRLIQVSLIKESTYAIRSMFIGFVIFSIGLSFVWLAANSLHITETDWIGGLPALIRALIVTEVGLLPLLYYMWSTSKEQIQKAQRFKTLANTIQDKLSMTKPTTARNIFNAADLDLPDVQALTHWLPFWDSGVSIFEMKIPDPQVEQKMVLSEKVKVQKFLKDLAGSDPLDVPFFQNIAQDLLQNSRIVQWEGQREMVFFILNAIAFYSYMLCVIVYYYNEETKQPYYIRTILFGLDNPAADWHGNFWGDLMWTIEPIVLLSTTAIFNAMRTPAKTSKVKSD